MSAFQTSHDDEHRRQVTQRRLADEAAMLPLTDEQRRQVLRRRGLVIGWESAVARGKSAGLLERDVTPGFLESFAAKGHKVSRSTLHIWRRAYVVDGLGGLVDQRWAGNADRRARALQLVPFFQELSSRYLGPGLLCIRGCHDYATNWAIREGKPAATLRESDRFIRAFVLPRIQRERGPEGGEKRGV